MNEEKLTLRLSGTASNYLHYRRTFDLDNKNDTSRKEPFESSKIPGFG